jgi:hypothetical protein
MLQQERERGCTPPQKKATGWAATHAGGNHEGVHNPRNGKCRKALFLATLVPIWSDDRRHFQGWEVGK